MTTTFQISAKIVWGFKVKFSNDLIDTLTQKELIEIIKHEMKITFQSLNLLELKELVDSLDLRFHSKIEKNVINYVCDYSQKLK